MSLENSEDNIPLNRLPNKLSFSRLCRLNNWDGKSSIMLRDRFSVVNLDVLQFQMICCMKENQILYYWFIFYPVIHLNCFHSIFFITIALRFEFLHLDCKNVFYLFIEKLNDVVILSSLILVSNHGNVYPENATLVVVLKMFIRQTSSEISNSVA